MVKPKSTCNPDKSSDSHDKGNSSQYETGTEESDVNALQISDSERQVHETTEYSDTDAEDTMVLRSRSKIQYRKTPSPFRKPGSPKRPNRGRKQAEQIQSQGDFGMYGIIKNAIQDMTGQVVAAIQTAFKGLSKQSESKTENGLVKSKENKSKEIRKLQNKRQESVESSASEGDETDEYFDGSCSDTDSIDTNELTESRSKSTSNKIRSGFSNAKLPPYTGKEKWEVWINRFEAVASLQNWNKKHKLSELLTRLQGEAGDFAFDQLNGKILTSYSKLVNELKNRFGVFENRRTFKVQFNRRTQKSNETPAEYSSELKRIYDKAYSNRDAKTRQEDLLQRFLMGLNDHNARVHIELNKDPKTIEEAVQEVITYFETTSENNENSKYKKIRQLRKPNQRYGAIKSAQNSDQINQINKKKENDWQNKQNPEKGKEILTLTKDELQQMFNKMYEDKVKSEGTKTLTNIHRQNFRQFDKSSPDNHFKRNGDQNVPICYFCGQPGHYARNCYSNPDRQSDKIVKPVENPNTPLQRNTTQRHLKPEGFALN